MPQTHWTAAPERAICRLVWAGQHHYLSGLWEEFIEFRIQRESQRLYPGYAANDANF